MYDLNRAICNIKLGASFEVIKSDLDKVLRLGPENGVKVRRPHPRKSRAIIEWIKQNQPHLQDWIKANDIQLPDLDQGG